MCLYYDFYFCWVLCLFCTARYLFPATDLCDTRCQLLLYFIFGSVVDIDDNLNVSGLQADFVNKIARGAQWSAIFYVEQNSRPGDGGGRGRQAVLYECSLLATGLEQWSWTGYNLTL